MALVVDTGVLYAAADTRDGDHDACSELLETHSPGELLVPATVITESAWLIADRLGDPAEQAFIASIAAGEVTAEPLITSDWARIAELLATYDDLHLGLVDASVIGLAERLNIITIATLNHRDFRVVRPQHIEVFELVP